jgi:DNA-binding Xre family transcriptional regulator
MSNIPRMNERAQTAARGKIERALKITGWTATKLAREAGVAASTLNKFLYQGAKHTVSLSTLTKIDEAVERFVKDVSDPRESIRLMLIYGGGGSVEMVNEAAITIFIRGAVKAGHWAEAMEWPAADWQPVTLPRPDGHRSYFGLRVEGPSMNEVYPEGTILVCVPMMDYDIDLENEDHVIVQRWAGGQVEATVKELRRDAEGNTWLWPRSTHPEHQTPIALPRTPPDELAEDRIEVAAVVVADYRIRKHRVK